MISFRRSIQIASLALFCILLGLAVYLPFSTSGLDFFLRLDPTLVAGTALSARVAFLSFLPAVFLILITLTAGRIFCGYICPMGTTLDGSDALARNRRVKNSLPESLGRVKYLVLIFIFFAGLLGVSLVFVASPLSLITRFYGLVVSPMVSLVLGRSLEVIQPMADQLDLRTLTYAQVHSIRFTTQFFILGFFVALAFTALWSPRFWCRYLCPSGALLALFSIKPWIRRRVSDDCTHCGACVTSCPMNAIPRDHPRQTRHQECITCLTCQQVCPVEAVRFSAHGHEVRRETHQFSPTRRQLILSGFGGAATAMVSLAGLSAPMAKSGEGLVAPPGLIRPPGALPEKDFLSRCVRCGECMAACPTNTLQPIWFNQGFMGIFSPAVIPRRGYCDPRCHQCAEVCPTRAINRITGAERIWAKIGTAVIHRQKCLAWEQQKPCMVCDEVCPYDAIQFKKQPGNPVAVPHVIENDCAGCGYCEHYCPVQNQAAIVVTAMGEIRIKQGNYEAEGRSRGLTLTLKPKSKTPYGQMPTTVDTPEGFAPGFDELSK
ncbi:MAG: 4Fe-4S binding protein [Deltaproteobacteria bacterium]|nr:4Fe-4S binding protein [Deltaproteobacteria bacterium]